MKLIDQLGHNTKSLDTDSLYIFPEDINLAIGTISIAGGPFKFSRVKVFLRNTLSKKVFFGTIKELLDWARKVNRLKEVETKLDLISSPRPLITELSYPIIFGVLNVTPDSFYDGGKFFNHDLALARGKELFLEGADIVDIGGESTRPGADDIALEDELDRVLPIINDLSSHGLISIDTKKSIVMQKALKAGANIINDVSALTGDSSSIDVVSKSNCQLVLMHRQGNSKNMQLNPNYNDPLLDIYDYLSDRIEICEKKGIDRSRIYVDPGIGFGQNDAHIKRIIKYVGLFHGLGCRVMLGFSRKSFISRWSENEAADDRLAGSLAAVLWSFSQSVQAFRVHDVKETRQALKIWSNLIF